MASFGWHQPVTGARTSPWVEHAAGHAVKRRDINRPRCCRSCWWRSSRSRPGRYRCVTHRHRGQRMRRFHSRVLATRRRVRSGRGRALGRCRRNPRTSGGRTGAHVGGRSRHRPGSLSRLRDEVRSDPAVRSAKETRPPVAGLPFGARRSCRGRYRRSNVAGRRLPRQIASGRCSGRCET